MLSTFTGPSPVFVTVTSYSTFSGALPVNGPSEYVASPFSRSTTSTSNLGSGWSPALIAVVAAPALTDTGVASAALALPL